MIVSLLVEVAFIILGINVANFLLNAVRLIFIESKVRNLLNTLNFLESLAMVSAYTILIVSYYSR